VICISPKPGRASNPPLWLWTEAGSSDTSNLLSARHPVRSLTSQDLEKLQLDIASGKTARRRENGRGGVATGGKGVAARTLGMIGAILEFAKRRRVIRENPARGVASLPEGKQRRAPFQLNLLGNAVRGTGNMGLPAGVIVGSVIAHVLISPVLIFGWGPMPTLGPADAGWGLVLSFGAGSVVLLLYLRSSRSLVRLAFRGAPLQWRHFAEILKVGVPGLINVTINNLSVVLLTGIAGYLGTEAAIGYAMGARLEYILIPLAFGFGTAIVAMVGTNCGAKQYRRAYQIAWREERRSGLSAP
jgi:hypothetical protein